MKKVLFYLFGSLLLPFGSCNSLELAPEDWYGSNSFWKNEAQVEGFVTGLHGNLRANYARFFTLGEARGGTMASGTSIIGSTSLSMSAPIKNNTFSVSSTGVASWAGIYSSLLQVNLLIEKLTNECAFLSPELRNNYLAQAHGFRALHYFLLYRTYGGVPLVTDVKVLQGQVSADKLYTARSTPKQVMEFIKQEINQSEAYYGSALSIDPSKARWSPYATLMLKAEIYLWSAKVTTADQIATGETDLRVAKTALEQVLAGPFRLMNHFAEVFTEKNAANTEVIFALRFADKEATNFGNEFVSQQEYFVNKMYGRNGALIETDTLQQKGTGGVLRHVYKFGLWASYDPADTRRDATFLDAYTKLNASDVQFSGGSMVLRKMIGTINPTNDRVYTTDWIVYRLSDALLMMAEVKNGLGEDPSPQINAVRARAYGEHYPQYTNQGKAENEWAILFERDKEFVCEGKRWFDIRRMQDASGQPLAFAPRANYTDTYPPSAASSSVLEPSKAYMLLWPVDVVTLSNDPLLRQTPDYPNS